MSLRNKREAKKSMFREFLPSLTVKKGQNPLKNIHIARHKTMQKFDVAQRDIEFLLWCYDLEFFTINYAAEQLFTSYNYLRNNTMVSLSKKNAIDRYFHKLTPSHTLSDHLFMDEKKMNYRVRYSISKKGREIVKHFYKELGINLDPQKPSCTS